MPKPVAHPGAGAVLRRALLLMLAWTAPAAAGDPAAPVDTVLEQMRDHLASRLPEVRREDIVRSASPGLFEVRAEHTIGYVTADGRFLLSGSLVDIDTGERITERRLNEDRLQTIAPLLSGAIEFAPAVPTQWITVFTDIDCQYCRLLHQEVPRLNEQGVGVRYLFFSRFGEGSKPYERARVVWCQKDRRGALDAVLRAGVVSSRKVACDDPVRQQYQVASDLSLRGTPVSIFPDGSVYYGYAKAEALIQELTQRQAAAAPVDTVKTEPAPN